MGKLKTVLFAFFIERTLGVEQGIGASQASAGVAEDIQIHSLLTFYRRHVSGWYFPSECAVSYWINVECLSGS